MTRRPARAAASAAPKAAGALGLAAQAAAQLARAELLLSFDATFPGSRPTAAQDRVLREIGVVAFRYVVAGNQSGKSALAAREIAWILSGRHPYGWTRPGPTAEHPGWGDGPLLIIIAGQSRQMMEVEQWGRKLKPLLDPDGTRWHEQRQGGQLMLVEDRETGDQIVFISHADSSEKNRKLMQGYVAHYVWLDEMPASIKVLEELQQRVAARQGYFLATFTPKFKNPAIKRVVESAPPSVARRYSLHKLDNPLYAARAAEERAKLAGHTEAYIRTVLEGAWLDGDDAVYEWNADVHAGEPDGYSTAWRHILYVDPATESKLGMTVWAEDPASSVWWCVRAEYVAGIYVPTKIIEEVERRVVGLNIVRRGADSHESWYIRQAAAMPDGRSYRYIGIEGKAGAKDGYIRGFQAALGSRVRIAQWCELLIDEIGSYERNPETGKIVKASRFHLLDSAHYFVATMPPPEKAPDQYDNWESRVFAAARYAERKQAARQAAEQRVGGHSAGRARYTTPAGGSPAADPAAPLPPAPRPLTPAITRIIRKRW